MQQDVLLHFWRPRYEEIILVSCSLELFFVSPYEKQYCCPALKHFSCQPLWIPVKLPGKKLQKATKCQSLQFFKYPQKFLRLQTCLLFYLLYLQMQHCSLLFAKVFCPCIGSLTLTWLILQLAELEICIPIYLHIT